MLILGLGGQFLCLNLGKTNLYNMASLPLHNLTRPCLKNQHTSRRSTSCWLDFGNWWIHATNNPVWSMESRASVYLLPFSRKDHLAL